MEAFDVGTKWAESGNYVGANGFALQPVCNGKERDSVLGWSKL